MYLNIAITVIGVVVLYWFVEGVISRLRPLNHKKMMARIKDKPIEFIDAESSMVSEFEKGNFEQSLKFAEQVLLGQSFNYCGLTYKAYSLYHLRKYKEAKEVFGLLNTLPGQNVTHMLEKIDSQIP